MQTDKWSVESLKKDFKGVYSKPITGQDPVIDPTDNNTKWVVNFNLTP